MGERRSGTRRATFRRAASRVGILDGMAVQTKTLTIDIPLVGTTELGDLLFDCESLIAQFVPTFVASASIDVEVTAKDVKDTVGALAGLVGDKQLDEFVNKAKKLVPEGKMGLKVALVPIVQVQPCSNDATRAAVITCVVYLLVQASISGKYGFVKGEAGVEILFRLARVIEICDCKTGVLKQELAMFAPTPEQLTPPEQSVGQAGRPVKSTVGRPDIPVGVTLVSATIADACGTKSEV